MMQIKKARQFTRQNYLASSSGGYRVLVFNQSKITAVNDHHLNFLLERKSSKKNDKKNQKIKTDHNLNFYFRRYLG